jgi:hypothetical protein
MFFRWWQRWERTGPSGGFDFGRKKNGRPEADDRFNLAPDGYFLAAVFLVLTVAFLRLM